jgi:hypothetical protein
MEATFERRRRQRAEVVLDRGDDLRRGDTLRHQLACEHDAGASPSARFGDLLLAPKPELHENLMSGDLSSRRS